MSGTPWLQETDTGRWFVWGPGPNGETVRRYEEELHAANPYQSQPTHQTESQSYREVHRYETGQAEIGQQSFGTPRTYQSEAGPNRLYDTSEQYQNEAIAGGRRREQKYYNPGGYNEQASGSSATYQTTVQASSSRNVGSDMNSLANDTARMRINSGSWTTGSNYGLSKSPPQPQGRGRGDYQSRGKAPATRAPSRPPLLVSTDDTRESSEPLDRSYRMRNTDWKKFFECGRVFKTLWTDAAGPENGSESSQFMSRATNARYQVAHKQWVYSKIRRFVVVSRHDRSCQCLPVTTYDGRGYKKRNIILEQHGLIYTSDQPPKPVPGIVIEPLRIKDAREELGVSYINYGRSYCVDTNVKVKEVGMLDGPSRRLLRKHYQSIHLPDDSEDESGPPPASQEEELRGAGDGLSIPLQVSTSQGYSASPYDDDTHYDGPHYDDAPSEPGISRYEESGSHEGYAASTASIEKTLYSPETSSSSRPRPRPRPDGRDSEIILEDIPEKTERPERRMRRESNANKGTGESSRRHRREK